MRVTRLELVGFKSFADKTRLDFTSGVTAVVGPNGCGKSNIADAIRWVFGEQRVKALRGGSMEDVIFAGTENRHPIGMAEVTLTVDNSDGLLHTPFTEVSVGRRRYRSGESEYLINKAPCRRLDVLQVFQDTGMGLDAFSYIEQGRIDQVLSTKPEDRRAIFEDAAGIVRYRKRQAEALRKLDRTDQNLGRLADTLQEVQRRCRSLKRQSAAAQRYRTLQEELRAEELRLARYEYDHAAADLKARAQSLRDVTDQLEGVGARVSSGEAAVEQARLRQLDLESTLSHAQQDVYRVESEADRAEAHIRLLDEKLRAAKERAQAAETELAILGRRMDDLSAQAEQALDAVARGEATAAAAAEAVRVANQELATLGQRIGDAERELEEQRQASLLVLNDKIAAENRRASVVGQIELVAGRLARVAEQVRHAEGQVAEQARRLVESRTRLERLTREREATHTALADAEAARDQCHQSRAGIEAELAGLRDSLTATRSKLRSLEQLRDQFEGFQVGVRSVLEGKRDGAAWARGAQGALADLIAIDRRYELALESALGSAVQSILTDTRVDSDRIIRHLGASDAGRVTCIPVADLIVHTAERPALPADTPGIVGWATDLVTASASVQRVLQHLLGDVLIVESLATAHKLAAALDTPPRVVTLDGDVLDPSGIRSGGAAAAGGGLIGRHNEIAALTTEAEALDAQVSARADTAAELAADLERQEGRVAEFARHAAGLDVEIRGLEQDCHRTLEALDAARERAQHVRTETSTILDERAEFLSQQEQAVRALEGLHNTEAAVQDRLIGAEHALSALLGDKDALNEQLTMRQVERSTAEHTVVTHRRDAERIAAVRAETDEQVAARQEDLAQARATADQVDCETGETRTRIQQLALQREEAQRTVTALQQERTALTTGITEHEQELRGARQEQQRLTEEAHQLDLQVTRLRDKLDGLRDHILTAYQVDLTDAPPLFTAGTQDATADPDGVELDVWDPETAAQTVDDLKARLERMGPVNLIAIEEYEEYKARAEYLEQQDADLKAARGTLLNVIRQISSTIEEKFTTTFHQVQEHFHKIFRVLFEGGRARLSLSDPEHPLESGIDIDVQPPGKQTQSISLLSGGERALTASALLFAVFQTRPSPFCILDELDAPLDDTNVLRLCRLIQKFAETTQFIVITHNKRTMELADTLYGITMEERGVSQVVSVRLTREGAPPLDADLDVGVAAG